MFANKKLKNYDFNLNNIELFDEFDEIETRDILIVVKSIKNNSSQGPDNINPLL